MKKSLKLQTKKVSKLSQNGNGEQNQKLTPIIVRTFTIISTMV